MNGEIVGYAPHGVTRPISGPLLPAIIAQADDYAARRFIEVFTATIRNGNTRRAYAKAVGDFLACREKTLVEELRQQIAEMKADEIIIRGQTGRRFREWRRGNGLLAGNAGRVGDLRLLHLPVEGPIPIRCSYAIGGWEYLGGNARRGTIMRCHADKRMASPIQIAECESHKALKDWLTKPPHGSSEL